MSKQILGPRFLKGDLVQMGKPLRQQMSYQGRTFGVVTSDQRDMAFVNVRLDGNKTSSRFAARFWFRVTQR